jgi:hypothetical protein
MRHLLVAALFMLGSSSLLFAQDENPFAKANEGDWAEYDIETAAMNIPLKGKLRLTVSSKTDKEAKIKAALTLEGQENPAFAQETTVDLSKPFDPTSATGLPGAAEAKVEKKEKDTTAKIKVAGKEYDCNVSTMKMTAKVNGQDFESEVKVWTSKEIPLASLAKMEVRSVLAEMKMTFAGSGSK